MKLLVVIPTWNRAEYLEKAIQAISEARAKAENCSVELFVSDNCSSDTTPEVMARWQGWRPGFTCGAGSSTSPFGPRSWNGPFCTRAWSTTTFGFRATMTGSPTAGLFQTRGSIGGQRG
ncbi:MAG: glycosyltransferase [Holophaga sp.]|nr:glycosyltransferase [Holophaga sp.]